MNYNETYIGNILNAISQLGNALLLGSSSISISARIGYYAEYYPNNYWLVLEWIVNKTFEPLDGINHCYKAYEKDVKEDFYYGKGGRMQLYFLSLIVLATCIPLAVIFWTYYLIKNLRV